MAVGVIGLAISLAACAGSSSGATSSNSGHTKELAPNLGDASVDWPAITQGAFTTPSLVGQTYTLALGNGQNVHWRKGSKLTIAFFEQGENNTYLQANVNGAEAAAKAAGVSLTVYNAQFEPQTQFSQIQNAIARGAYNAAIVLPVASQGSCKQLTNSLPAAGLPVVVIAQQTCGRDEDSGSALWSPGTVAWVGHDWPLFYKTWIQAVVKTMTSPTEAVMIDGPAGNGPSNVAASTAAAVARSDPNFRLEAVERTDYTTAEALTDTQDLLQAHPAVKVILVQYGGQAPGVIAALKEAGKLGKVEVFDGSGGSAVEKTEIEAGELVSTVGQYPYTQAYCAVSMLVALHNGRRVPRVVPNDCHTTNGSAGSENVTIYDKANLASFHPEY